MTYSSNFELIWIVGTGIVDLLLNDSENCQENEALLRAGERERTYPWTELLRASTADQGGNEPQTKHPHR